MKHRLIPPVLCLLLLLGGCGNYRELNEFDIVAGMAIDQSREGYKVTLELINLEGSLQEGVKSYPVSLEGATVPQALEQAKSKLSRQFHYGNMEVIVLSHQVAEQGIASLLDGFLRDVNIRETIQLAISLGETAEEILAAKGQDLSVASYALSKMIAHANDTQLQPRDVSIYNALDALQTPGKSLILPAVKAEPTTQEDTCIQLEGLAVFRQDSLSYTLPEAYIPFYLFGAGRLGSHDLAFELPGGEKKSTIHITQSKTKRSFWQEAEHVVFQLDIRAKGQLDQAAAGSDLRDPSVKSALEQAAAQALCDRMLELLDYQRQKGDTNVADWEHDIYMKDGSLWEAIESKSEEARPGVSMEVHVTVEILDSGIVRGV